MKTEVHKNAEKQRSACTSHIPPCFLISTTQATTPESDYDDYSASSDSPSPSPRGALSDVTPSALNNSQSQIKFISYAPKQANPDPVPPPVNPSSHVKFKLRHSKTIKKAQFGCKSCTETFPSNRQRLKHLRTTHLNVVQVPATVSGGELRRLRAATTFQ